MSFSQKPWWIVVFFIAASEVEMRIIDPTSISIRKKGLDLMGTSIPNDIMLADWYRRRAASMRRQRRKRGNTAAMQMIVHASFVENG